MTSFTSTDLRSLAGLLNLKEELDSADECDFNSGGSSYNPHQVAQDIKTVAQDIKTVQSKEINLNVNSNKCIATTNKDIWSDDEVQDEDDDEAKIKDKPEYEMIYQQNVSPDDIFFQFSGKGPGSDSCECLLVKIKLPGVHSKEEVNLNLSALQLICKTKKYYLKLDLPKEVDPVKCSAKWDQDQSLLTAILFIDIDYKLKF